MPQNPQSLADLVKRHGGTVNYRDLAKRYGGTVSGATDTGGSGVPMPPGSEPFAKTLPAPSGEYIPTIPPASSEVRPSYIDPRARFAQRFGEGLVDLTTDTLSAFSPVGLEEGLRIPPAVTGGFKLAAGTLSKLAPEPIQRIFGGPSQYEPNAEAAGEHYSELVRHPIKSFQENPAGVMGDVSLLATGVGGLARAGVRAAGLAGSLAPSLARPAVRIAGALEKASPAIQAVEAIDPIAMGMRGVGAVVRNPVRAIAQSRSGTGKLLDPKRMYARSMQLSGKTPEEIAKKTEIGMKYGYGPDVASVERNRSLISEGGEELGRIVQQDPTAPVYMNTVLDPLKRVHKAFKDRPYYEGRLNEAGERTVGDMARIEGVRETYLNKPQVRPSHPQEMRSFGPVPREVSQEIAPRPPSLRETPQLEEIPFPEYRPKLDEPPPLPEQAEMPLVSPHEGSPGGELSRARLPEPSVGERFAQAGIPSVNPPPPLPQDYEGLLRAGQERIAKTPEVPSATGASPQVEQGTIWSSAELPSSAPPTRPAITSQREIIPELPQGTRALSTAEASGIRPSRTASPTRALERGGSEAQRALADIEATIADPDFSKLPIESQASAKRAAESLRNQLATPGTEPVVEVADAQALNRGIYDELGDRAYGEQKGPEVEALKGAGHGFREEIARVFPEAVPVKAQMSEGLEIMPDLMAAAVRGGFTGGAWVPLFPSAKITGLLQLRHILSAPQTRARFALWLDKKPVPADPGMLTRAVRAIPAEKMALLDARINEYLEEAERRSVDSFQPYGPEAERIPQVPRR